MPDCEPSVTPSEQKLNYTKDAEKRSSVRKYRGGANLFDQFRQ